MGIGFSRLMQRIDKKLNREVRLRVKKPTMDALTFRWLITDPTLSSVDKLSRDGQTLMHIIEVVREAGLDADDYEELAWKMVNDDPTNELHARWGLPRAFKVLEQVEGMGAKINVKIEALKAEKNNPYLRDMFALALNWQYAFGIGGAFSVNLDVRGKSAKSSSFRRWFRFIEWLHRANKRPANNNEHRDKLQRMIEKLPRRWRKWAIRVVYRDLRIRVGSRTARKVWPRLIPIHGVQLCRTIKKDAPEEEWTPGEGAIPKYAAEAPKLDGFRVVIEVYRATEGREHGQVRSRTGLEQAQHYHLVKQAAALCRAAGVNSGVFDGEATDPTGKSWAAASSAVTRNDPEYSKANLVFWCFDFLPRKVFHDRKGGPRRVNRLAKLDAAFAGTVESSRPNIKPMPVTPMPVGLSAKKARKWLLKRYQQHRDNGYEGQIIYDLEAPYKAGDSSSDRKASGLTRIKPFHFLDVLIVGFFEGKGERKGKLGGFVCVTEEGIKIRVGGGYKKHELESFWKDRKALVGRVIEVERQEDTPGIKSRHTNFKRLRPKGDKWSAMFEGLA